MSYRTKQGNIILRSIEVPESVGPGEGGRDPEKRGARDKVEEMGYV